MEIEGFKGKYLLTLWRLKSLKALHVPKALLWVQVARMNLRLAHTQHFLPHPQLKLLPVSGQPFLSSTHASGTHPSKGSWLAIPPQSIHGTSGRDFQSCSASRATVLPTAWLQKETCAVALALEWRKRNWSPLITPAPTSWPCSVPSTDVVLCTCLCDGSENTKSVSSPLYRWWGTQRIK